MVAESTSKDNSGIYQQKVGADWEDAFQAEDFLISPDAAPETLFNAQATLKADDLTGTKGGQQSSSPKAAGEKSALPAVEASIRKKGALPPLLLTVLEAIGNSVVFVPLQRLPGGLGQRFSLLAPVPRGAILILTAVLMLGGGGLFFMTVRGEPVALDMAVVQETLGKKGKAPATWPATEELKASTPVAGEVSRSSSGQVGMNGIDRHKWRFSSFMVEAGYDEAGNPSYVVVDLSLIMRLAPGEDLPTDKEYAIRNMIYQFFSNRPPYELRRFSLARGEMKQKLLSWFNKEWPENRVESILFHRYQII